MSNDSPITQISLLTDNIASNPNDWKSRKECARILYDEGKTKEAADLIWDAPAIPSIDLEIGFAVKILSKGAPGRAIRLLAYLQELNANKPVQNMALANALLHHGMVMQAARFYGAAIQLDPTLVNPNLEHFLLWVDDSEKLWGDFADKPKVFAELPWIKRSTKEEAARLAAFKSGHTTPIKIPGLAQTPGELGSNPMYTQDSRLNKPVTPPPAVTIPMDRVEEKDRIIDNLHGADSQPHRPIKSTPSNGSAFGTPLPVIPLDPTQPPASPSSTPLPAILAPVRKPRLLTPPTQLLNRASKPIHTAPSIKPSDGSSVTEKS